jgi:hypothetical protein
VESAENQERGVKKAARFGPLERALGLSHITFVQAATSASEPEHSVFRDRNTRLHKH